MTFDEYQKVAWKTAIHPGAGDGDLTYPVLGLVAEAGEVASKLTKVIRDDGGEISPERRADFRGELGDVLWYLAAVATELKISLDDIAEENIKKLASRLKRGVLGGSGDKR